MVVQQDVRFFSLNKQRDWDLGMGYNLEMSDHGIQIAQTRKYALKTSFQFDEISGFVAVCDFALGERKTIYLLGLDTSIWIYDIDSHHVEQLLPSNHEAFTAAAKMAVVHDTLMLADPFGNQKLTALNTTNGQTLWSWNGYEDFELLPLAVSSDRQGHFYVLIPYGECDEDGQLPSDTPLAVLQLEHTGRMIRTYRIPKLTIGESFDSKQEGNHYFLTAGEEQLFIFDAWAKTLYALGFEDETTSILNLPGSIQYAGLATDSSKSVYIGDCRSLDAGGEDDRHILCFTGMGQSITSLSGYRGRVDKLLIDEEDRIYALNVEERHLSILELAQRTRVMEHTGLPEGVYYSRALDCTVQDMDWHKIVVQAQVPVETQVRISFYASDRKEVLIDGEWTDLDQYILNTEIHPYMKQQALHALWSKPIVNPKDALLFQAEGRYLWLRIELIGSELKSPTIHRLRVYFPRTSYLEYLPAVYQQDERSRDFLERYLSLLGTFLEETEETINDISRYFDPDAVSGEYLRWLGTWLGIADEGRWTQSQLRELIRLAPQLYKKRGTRFAIETWVRLFTGETPYIIEYHEWKQFNDNAQLKKALSELYGKNPHSFCVLVKPHCIQSEEQRNVLQQLIEEEKPAYTEAKLVILQPWMYMDMHTYLGINTYLSEPTVLHLDEQSSLPYNTVIVDLNRDRRLDIHTRLGLDSELE